MKVKKGKRNNNKGPRLPDEFMISGDGEGEMKKSVKPPYTTGGKGFNGRVSSVKSRKDLRKELRKAKKSQKHQYILVKCGREDLVKKMADGLDGKKKKRKKKKKNNKKKGDNKRNEGVENKKGNQKDKDGGEESSSDTDQDEDDKKFVVEAVKNHLEQRETMDLAEELKTDQKKLKKEMDEVRRKRLIEENEEEEKTINQLSKKLKLNKKSTIPSSFRADGLDFVLELCKKSGEKGGEEEGSGDEDAIDDDDNDDEDVDDGFDEEDDEEEAGSEFEGDEDEDEESFGKLDDEVGDEEESVEDSEGEDNFDEEMDDMQTDDEGSETEKPVKSNKSKKEKQTETNDVENEDDGVWEDIYGRLRLKDGTVVHSMPGMDPEPAEAIGSTSQSKYIPPALRGKQSNQEKLSKQLKGLLNRLSESNMHSIATQIEEMYMTNSRNEVNQTLLELLKQALVRPTVTPERVVLEHIMLIAVMHANVGTEVGAFFIQSFTQDFKSKYDAWDFSANDTESKYLENLIQIISFIYHFKIIGAGLVYDILKFLGDSFRAKDVELILTVLRSIGFRLRKDDPTKLKELIVTLQQKASKLQSGDPGSAKVKFMLEVLMAIRNNNMNKIPNYDPSFGEHLYKILKSHLHTGNYVSEMNIGLQDLLNANMSGRWWIVGSAWAGKEAEKNTGDSTQNSDIVNSADALKRAKLMKRARAQGMNTDTRRDIFCILMTAEDFMDAFEKLNHLGLRNNQDREIMHVSSYCCLQEKKFNPYYAFILSKFCASDRKLMLALQFSLWDRLKDLESLSIQQRTNLAHLLVHLINDKSLPLSTLKVVEYAEMDKIKLKFLKIVMTGILLQKDLDNLQEIFVKPALSEKLALFRESLRLFLNHFMLQSLNDGKESKLSPDEIKILKQRIKIAEKCFTSGLLK